MIGLLSRLGLPVVPVLLALGAAIGAGAGGLAAYHVGHGIGAHDGKVAARAECQAAALAAELAAAKIDLGIAATRAEEHEAEARELADAALEADERAQKYADLLSRQPGDRRCAATPDDARWLSFDDPGQTAPVARPPGGRARNP